MDFYTCTSSEKTVFSGPIPALFIVLRLLRFKRIASKILRILNELCIKYFLFSRTMSLSLLIISTITYLCTSDKIS